MEHKLHDTIAKVVIGVLARHREQIPEAELRVPVFGDILLRPGPPLPEATGLLGRLVGMYLVLLEYFSRRPTAAELLGVHVKAWMGMWLELRNEDGFAGHSETRIILVGNGLARKSMKRALSGARWECIARGMWFCTGPPAAYYIDLVRMPLTLDTAWLHVSGNSVWVNEALGLLQAQPDALTRALLARISEELPHMQIEKSQASEQNSTRFLKAWEEAAAVRRGLSLGLSQGYHEMLGLLLRQKFGPGAEPLIEQLASVSDPTVLQQVAGQLLTASAVSDLHIPSSVSPG